MTRILPCLALAIVIGFAVPVAGSDPVTYFSGDQTRAAFAAGKPLPETDAVRRSPGARPESLRRAT
jgi:hypothetical protein